MSDFETPQRRDHSGYAKIIVRIPVELYQPLFEAARASNTSIGAFARDAIVAALRPICNESGDSQ
jgi:hypothetical protein